MYSPNYIYFQAFNLSIIIKYFHYYLTNYMRKTVAYLNDEKSQEISDGQNPDARKICIFSSRARGYSLSVGGIVLRSDDLARPLKTLYMNSHFARRSSQHVPAYSSNHNSHDPHKSQPIYFNSFLIIFDKSNRKKCFYALQKSDSHCYVSIYLEPDGETDNSILRAARTLFSSRF